jgi:RHS repeat-associated protein
MGCLKLSYYEQTELKIISSKKVLTLNKTEKNNRSSYLYGFNGKEQDKETSSTTTYDYGFRIYNPALGRFLSVDPLIKNFPWWTPYQFAGNTPVQAVDLDGLEILLPQTITLMPRPILALPRLPNITIPSSPGQITLPPLIPQIPNHITIGQPKLNASENIPIGWENPPSSPNDLNADWKEVTDPRNNSGSRDFKNEKTGEKIRFDPGKEDANGWEGKNHWHRYNPESKNKGDYYLDKNGKPVPKGSEASHLEAPKTTVLPNIIVTPERENKNFFQRLWEGVKEFFRHEKKKELDANMI